MKKKTAGQLVKKVESLNKQYEAAKKKTTQLGLEIRFAMTELMPLLKAQNEKPPTPKPAPKKPATVKKTPTKTVAVKKKK